jgi:peroxiredoxin
VSLEVGDLVPAAAVQRAPGDETTFAELAADGPILLVFYLFDWSST